LGEAKVYERKDYLEGGEEMKKPEAGEFVSLYNRGSAHPESLRVVEWIGNRCFMTDGYSFKWDDALGFVSY
jgi:hypothetical protein